MIAFSDTDRHFVSLYRDDHVDVWLLCWTRDNDTGWHDHDISAGAVHVVEGAFERVQSADLAPADGPRGPRGAVVLLGPEHIHRLAGQHERSVSIHAYSPPLWRLGQYAIDADGVMQRISVSYADELRPLEHSVAA